MDSLETKRSERISNNMKRSDITYTLIILLLFFLLIKERLEQPKTDLPEEYELITPDTPIEGQYKDGVLIIKFKH